MSHAAAGLIAARAAIARAVLDALPPAQLGDIVLRLDQRRIIARAQRALGAHGGCLIGEDVGRGKTFVALALARRWGNPLVVAPAGLRTTWLAAQAHAGVPCAFVSHESLSRGRSPSQPYSALIVDESHHFRNPSTMRYAQLARMAAAVPIVLLSATPLQNRPRDLAAQLALYLGEGAFALDAESLAGSIIRGDAIDSDDMPAVAPAEWLPVHAHDDAVLLAIVALPPPARALDGGDAGVLRTLALVRAWASSRAALKSTLRSRRRVAAAVAQGLDAGRVPTRRELREWRSAGDVVQLGFAAVLMAQSLGVDSLDEVRRQLEDDDVAYAHVRAALQATADPDPARVDVIRALRSAHRDCRIIAFSEYASTVSSYFDTLRRDAGVGVLTARGAHIATGRIPRDEILARFAPRAQGATAFAPHDEVTLLLTTDILSEGVNLQDASVVLHLDLPWNPARLAQRVGRVRRPGGATVVRSYLLAPPAHADALLAADARLRRKLEQARRVLGASFDVLPSLGSSPVSAAGGEHSIGASAAAAGALVDELQRWKADDFTPGQVHIGAAVYHARGWLAVLDDGRIVGSLHHVPSESVARVSPLVTAAAGVPRLAAAGEVAVALSALDRWLHQQELLDTCGVVHATGPLRRAVAAHLTTIVRHARRHEHARVLGLVSRLRQQLARPMPLGAERALCQQLQMAAAEPDCVMDMLTKALNDIDGGARSRALDVRSERASRVIALIVVGPAGGDGAHA